MALEACLAEPEAGTGNGEEVESSIEGFVKELWEKRNKRAVILTCR